MISGVLVLPAPVLLNLRNFETERDTPETHEGKSLHIQEIY